MVGNWWRVKFGTGFPLSVVSGTAISKVNSTVSPIATLPFFHSSSLAADKSVVNVSEVGIGARGTSDSIEERRCGVASGGELESSSRAKSELDLEVGPDRFCVVGHRLAKEVVSDPFGRLGREFDIGRLGSVTEIEEADADVGARVIAVFGVIIDGVCRKDLDAAVGTRAAAGRDVVRLRGDGAGPPRRGAEVATRATAKNSEMRCSIIVCTPPQIYE